MFTRRSMILVLGSVLLAGRAWPMGVCEEGGKAPRLRPLFFAMKVLDAKQAKGYRVLRKGETAKSGEQYLLSIDIPERAYVYVVQDSPDGTRQQLWPAPKAQPTPWDAATTLNLPQGSALQLDKVTGTEVIAVVASPVLLSPEKLAEAVKNAPEPRDAEETNKGNRGGKSERVHTCAAANAVLSLRFPFRHE